ncbi:MAG TPA: sugar ABC transporter permease [Candidatus Sumerlaeota bacterium]|nr:MAG: Lactose transport system permease protein LacF [candidate division BRC1 bacterium ADurb.Bin183]HOE64741.1 sugar ABC transporter permease [Candidatus Sumerlaeota bacterium]HRR31531.1 sugar ABC transporter permease [Candidatus Sumerlaeia bacterium]HON50762.1 sugar ABC transporter permease [Candidatus Sumerlaeota bacterium]HOR65120.1 sugar ABC transporter permease [Candidatus Sumerlaeota bacterium]
MKKTQYSILAHWQETARSPVERRNLRNGLLFIAPWLIGLIVFTLYPICASFYWSFCRFDGFSPPVWAGVDNYRVMLLEDPLFWRALVNTFYMVLIAMPITLAFSLFLAILLDLKVRGQSIYRTILYLPSIAPVIAVSVLWMWLLNPEYGLINHALRLFGIDMVGWLVDPKLAKPALILMGLWQAGGGMLIFLAGLQEVPPQLYEAAEVDGAGIFTKFRHVTLPMISPILLFNLIMGIIGYFQYFTQAFVMTQGGPQDATLFYALHLFNRAFLDFQLGYASAMAWLLFLLILAATIFVMKTSRRWVYYEGEGSR